MKPDHPVYGPQFDADDGTIGTRTQCVKRYVLVHGVLGHIWTARQGRCTHETEPEAQARVELIKANNQPQDYPEDLRVAPFWCYPGHFDPAGPVGEVSTEEVLNLLRSAGEIPPLEIDNTPPPPTDPTTGREATWGQGIFGDGQKGASEDFAANRPFDDNLRFMSADYRAGYQQEWQRLQKLHGYGVETPTPA